MKTKKDFLLIFLFFIVSSFTAKAQISYLDQQGASYFISSYGYPDWDTDIILYGSTGSSGCFRINEDPNACFIGQFDKSYYIYAPGNQLILHFDVNIADPSDWVLIYEINPYDQPELIAVAYGSFCGDYISKYSTGHTIVRIIKGNPDNLYPTDYFRGVYFSWEPNI